MSYSVTTWRAFTDGEALRGNAAGVCLVERFPNDDIMQSIAEQMGHAETAFLVNAGTDRYRIRWFTPATEVPLCGHATLAAAAQLRKGDRPLKFETNDGTVLTAEFNDAQVSLTLPRRIIQPVDAAIVQPCLNAPILAAYTSGDELLVEVADSAAVRACRIDTAALMKREEMGIIVTAKGDGDCDYCYRYFAPKIGLAEDPVTGSVNGLLAPYWEMRLKRTTFDARQLSAQGGALTVALLADGVRVGGKALREATRVVEPHIPMGAAA